ncbi:MAG: acyl-CoA dehydrogenase family protein [Candidatus Hodarchaeales archaeon]|jgi:butyryl-CoA dehydrogenase
MTYENFYTSVFYTPEEQEFQKEVRKFVSDEIAPDVDNYIGNNDYPHDLMKKVGNAGYLGVFHDPAYGGLGKGAIEETIVSEEISAAFPAFDMGRAASSAFYGISINRFCTEEQKQKYLTPIIKGDKIGAICITEREVGSDVAGMKTRAWKDGDKWILDGNKRFITNGGVADYLVVFAITNPDIHPHKGMSAFIVDREWEGFELIRNHELMGMNNARVSELEFNKVEVPDENLIASEGMGFKVVMAELDFERATIAGEALGYMRVPFETALKYSNERIQFDKPIRTFEGISFKIADMITKMDAARLLTIQAARLIDQWWAKDPASVTRKEESIRTRAATESKMFATEVAFDITDMALQICGGTGYSKDLPIERFFRDARLMSIAGGTAEILRFLIQRETYKLAGI